MSRPSRALLLLSVSICVVALFATSSQNVAAGTTIAGVVSDAETASTLQAKGRYKKQGDNCVWDAKDGGPDQCAPRIKGRFKKGGDDSCTWDANDVGDDQCRPPKGRWKRGGDNSCAWDASDGGPDQCNPRQARDR